MKRFYETPVIQCLDIGCSSAIAASGDGGNITTKEQSSGLGVKIVNFASEESDYDF